MSPGERSVGCTQQVTVVFSYSGEALGGHSVSKLCGFATRASLAHFLQTQPALPPQWKPVLICPPKSLWLHTAELSSLGGGGDAQSWGIWNMSPLEALVQDWDRCCVMRLQS